MNDTYNSISNNLDIINPPEEILNFLSSRINFTGIFKDKKYKIILNNIKNITSFLPDNASISNRKHHIINKTNYIPTCIICNKNVSWSKDNTSYSKWCSSKCKNKDPEFKEKIKQTNIIKYGVGSYTLSDEFKEKYKKHMQETYGVDHYLHNDNKKEEILSLRKEKYGYHTPFANPSIKEKIKHTFIEKYGCHPTQYRFSQNTLNCINNREWLYNEHINNQKTLTEISKELENYDISSLSDMMKYHNIPILSMLSLQESNLHTFIESIYEILINVRNIIPPYELDIHIPSHNLAIEYHGVHWHSEKYKDNNYHKMKYDLCKEKGIRLISIFEDEWLHNEDLIKKKLLHILGKSTEEKIFARKTIIKQVTKNEKVKFFQENHIQGDGPSSINLGLYYNDKLISCIGFIKNNNVVYNLSRYATSCNVVGGFTKLLTYFENQYRPAQVFTFADLRWSEGDLYYKSGFILDKELPPDYSYVIKDMRYHKFNFRHKSLAKKLENYDPTLSEHQNCLNNGIYRIYDCGKLRFIKNYNQ